MHRDHEKNPIFFVAQALIYFTSKENTYVDEKNDRNDDDADKASIAKNLLFSCCIV